MNGHEVKQRPQTAREMTEEINRATDVIAAPSMERGFGDAERGFGGVNQGFGDANQRFGGVERKGMDQAQARGIGGLAMGQVLTYNPEARRSEYEAVQGRDADRMMGVAGKSLGELEQLSASSQEENERVRETAELDSGYVRNEIAPNLSSVGLASKVEQAEYQATDLANAAAELDPATFEDEIQNKSQEEVGKAMAIRIGKLLKRRSFRPNDAVEWRDKGMLDMFERFKNKRVFKERNG